MANQIDLQFKPVEGREDAEIVEFHGDLDATNVESVLENIMSKFQEGFVFIIADFSDLRYVNSTGLGILLHFSKIAGEKGGRFMITNVNENVYEIIEIIGANSLLEIHDTLEDALKTL
ncbi:MAG: STAS domain-containing protein [Fibrobacterota bacterium]